MGKRFIVKGEESKRRGRKVNNGARLSAGASPERPFGCGEGEEEKKSRYARTGPLHPLEANRKNVGPVPETFFAHENNFRHLKIVSNAAS